MVCTDEDKGKIYSHSEILIRKKCFTLSKLIPVPASQQVSITLINGSSWEKQAQKNTNEMSQKLEETSVFVTGE